MHAGRMGNAYEALELLLSTSKEEAQKRILKITKYNNDRQLYEKEIFEDAINQIENNHLENRTSLVLGGDGWHHGVVGIVASKITDMYYKPCILVCFENNEDTGRGSGRSIEGFDLHEALMKCKNCLEGFGGHKMAIGLTIKKENLPVLQERFEILAKEANLEEKSPVINIEKMICIDEINKDIVRSLEVLEPLGEGNRMPIFAFKNLKIDSIRALSEGKHLKLTLKSDKNTYINAIGFNLGHLADDFVIGDKVDVCGSLEINSFNGVESIQINLKDMM